MPHTDHKQSQEELDGSLSFYEIVQIKLAAWISILY